MVWRKSLEGLVSVVMNVLCTCQGLSHIFSLCRFLSVSVMHIAWYSEDKPFAVGYADGKLLIGSKEPLEKGAIVVIDAHKV